VDFFLTISIICQDAAQVAEFMVHLFTITIYIYIYVDIITINLTLDKTPNYI